ncbi:hypothetical protein K438DRAFT_1935293 [Mycena galopus ATCC 62051]|nr:hypothetical protein K438DRAFT_1935293 [Mycena galopus ATCC 62051]
MSAFWERIDVDRGLYSMPRPPAVLAMHLPRWRATTRIFLTTRSITSLDSTTLKDCGVTAKARCRGTPLYAAHHSTQLGNRTRQGAGREGGRASTRGAPCWVSLTIGVVGE